MGQTENRLFFESAVTYTLFLYKSSKKLTSDCSACGHQVIVARVVTQVIVARVVTQVIVAHVLRISIIFVASMFYG